MERKNCTVIYFDDEGTFKNGETEKARPIIEYLQTKFDGTFLISTRNWKKRPVRLLHKILSYVKKSQFVFIVLSINGAKLLGSLLTKYCRKRHIKVVYLMVGIGPVKLEFNKNATPKEVTDFFKEENKWAESKLPFAKTFRNFDAVFVESETLKRVCESIYKADNVFVLKNFRKSGDFLETDDFVPKDKPSFIVFSRLNKAKGILQLIEACTVLNNKKLLYNIDIYGSISEEIEDEMAHLPNNLLYKGTVSTNKTKVLNQYDAIIFPTLHWEGMPGTLVEASMAHLPIICSDFTFARDIVVNGINGFIYEFGSVSELAKTMEYAINNRGELRNMRNQAAIVGEGYIAEKCLPVLEDYLHSNGLDLE